MAKRFLKYNDNLVSINGNLVQIEVDSATVSKIAEEKTVTPTTTQQIITPTDNDHELSKVTISAIQTETKTVTTNGDVTPSAGKFLSKVTVNVQSSEPTLQEKTITPTTSQQEITPDSGYDGLSKVVIGAVTNSIDSNIQASNIKSGVTILGITGTLEIAPTITYDASTGTLTITDEVNDV